jgi:hypothetical protein
MLDIPSRSIRLHPRMALAVQTISVSTRNRPGSASRRCSGSRLISCPRWLPFDIRPDIPGAVPAAETTPHD